MTVNEPDSARAKRAELCIGPLRFRISVLIYASIVSLASLAVYDEPDQPITPLSILTVLVIVLAPVTALAIAHLFAELAHEHLLLGRNPRWREITPLVTLNLQFLIVAIPVIIWMPIAAGLDLSTDDAVVLLMLFKTAALFAFGFVIAKRSQASGWFRAVVTLVYGFVGLGIVLAELILGH